MQFTEIYWLFPVHTTFPVLWNQTCLSTYDCLALWWSVNPYTTTANGVFFSSGGRCLTLWGEEDPEFWSQYWAWCGVANVDKIWSCLYTWITEVHAIWDSTFKTCLSKYFYGLHCHSARMTGLGLSLTAHHLHNLRKWTKPRKCIVWDQLWAVQVNVSKPLNLEQLSRIILIYINMPIRKQQEKFHVLSFTLVKHLTTWTLEMLVSTACSTVPAVWNRSLEAYWSTNRVSFGAYTVPKLTQGLCFQGKNPLGA